MNTNGTKADLELRVRHVIESEGMKTDKFYIETTLRKMYELETVDGESTFMKL